MAAYREKEEIEFGLKRAVNGPTQRFFLIRLLVLSLQLMAIECVRGNTVVIFTFL